MEEDNSAYYTAKQAKADYDAKKSQKHQYVDEKKIGQILDEIRKKIESLDSNNSESSSFPYPEYAAGYLSPGEVVFLKKLGYKVEYTDGGIQGDFWKISW
jgi:hypothetical protein